MQSAFKKIALLALLVGVAAVAQTPKLPISPITFPDLAIVEVDFRIVPGYGDFREHEFWIGIKNIGSHIAGESKVAVFIVTDVTSGRAITQTLWLFGVQNVPQIAAGDGLKIPVKRWLSTNLSACCVIVVVDAPVEGKPLGQLLEGDEGEKNNGFVFFLTPSYELQTFKNPAFEE